jgi:hypothetical protein
MFAPTTICKKTYHEIWEYDSPSHLITGMKQVYDLAICKLRQKEYENSLGFIIYQAVPSRK